MSAPIICFYHKNCLDGLAAAWVAKRFFDSLDLPGVQFVPSNYGDPTPTGLKGHAIYLLDFSFKRAETEALMLDNQVIVLDHHESAAKELEGLFEIDQTHSGVMLAWNHFQRALGENAPPPIQLAYIEDRDLWNFNLEHTKAFISYAFSRPLTLESFEEFMGLDVDSVIMVGQALLRKQQTDVAVIVKNARRISIDEFDVPVVNGNHLFASDIGAILSVDEPFAVIYEDLVDTRKFSLRSQKIGGEDVSVIAERWGGGGHKNAAGFSITLGTPEYAESHVLLNSEEYIEDLYARHCMTSNL